MAFKQVRRIFIIFIMSFMAVTATAMGDILKYEGKYRSDSKEENKVKHQCLKPDLKHSDRLPLKRKNPWSLPEKALAADFFDTLNVLALRFNFQYEMVDDPNTTGRGHFDLTDDSAAFFNAYGHYIDPPPHNAEYFGAHLRALRRYYETISDSKISLSWDIYPMEMDSAYELPHPMSYYGACDFSDVVTGLENYFVDCIELADNTNPEIDFSQYDAIILFHAGSDQQNNIGFPETCADLFTGFISFGDSVAVDNGTVFIREAMLMPETGSQDNRATALNAVMAHEFGHVLGLPDLYSSATFMSQLGDFALMDNNGFSTGIDFGFNVGRVFGAIPVYASAWCRAYLGFVDVVDFRAGSDIELVAAEIVSNGIKVARVPISENEYYLLENRVIEFDGFETGAQADTNTSVILGPAYYNEFTQTIEKSREYDFLLPGSGVLIYHVDEKVAVLDYDYDGLNNFEDNDLQWAWDIFGNRVDRFIGLVEADGFVNFGGYYRSGFGDEVDMYRDDRNNSLTPNSNPPSIDNTGNNSHIYITKISRKTNPSIPGALMDTVITFDVETDKLVSGFPVRAGAPSWPISPIVDDIDGDGNDEIICVSGYNLLVFTTEGNSFIREYTGCNTCPIMVDTAVSTVHPGIPIPIPIYAKMPDTIQAGPVTGRFIDDPDTKKLVAVAIGNRVDFYRLVDNNNDGMADIAGAPPQGFFFTNSTEGAPVAMTFGDVVFVLTDAGHIIYKDSVNRIERTLDTLTNSEYHGICRTGEGLILMAGDAVNSKLYHINPITGQTDSVSLDDYYVYGPVLADVNLDGVEEVIAGSKNGDVIMVSYDSQASEKFTVLAQRSFGYELTVNPVVGDIDNDGYPDIIFGGRNAIIALNHQLTLKSSYPIEINDRFPNDRLVASPIIANIDKGGVPEIAFPSGNGNMYSYSVDDETFGFPLSAGEMGIGSPIFINDTAGGKFGYLGLDGWFYLWDVDSDTDNGYWVMNGADPSGSFNFNESLLPPEKVYAEKFDETKYYNYPNPVTEGVTTLRYFLGEEARSVKFAVYNMMGEEIDSFDGPTDGMVDNEYIWECGDVTPGVYRCVINVDFNGETKTSFCDIAIID